MKSKSKKIIRALLLSATVALFHGSAKADSKKSLSLDLDLGLGNGGASPEVSKGSQPIVKNVYKILRSGDAKLIASHRSHSSHRSSRGGHYSHSSSSHYSHSSSSYGSSSSTYTRPAKTAGDYTMGDRTLSSGMYGSDVDKLVQYLINYYYLKDGIVSKKNGYSIYDANVVSAVKHFQKDAGFTQDGKANEQVIKELQSWSSLQTSIPLGFRKLTVVPETAGYDVDEIVQLLINAGYPPDRAKLKKRGERYIYSMDIIVAIKMFQAFNGLQPSGELNAATLTKLKTFKK